MAVATPQENLQPFDFRAGIRTQLTRILRAPEAEAYAALLDGVTPDSVWDVAHPVHRLEGPEAIWVEFWSPIRSALAHAYRRDELFFGGRNTRAQGGQWIAALSHYVGRFERPLFGIPPSDRLVFLRSGAFFRIEDGRIAEAKIILDLPDLMRQAGRFPLPRELGTEMLFPGPASHDGVLPAGDNGADTLRIVEGMLGDLHHYDPVTAASYKQTGEHGYWHDDMMWYGPGGIGSNYRWSGFVDHHRAAFLTAFPDRKGGNHYCRIGDGDYAAVSGWPSMTMTHTGAYLGVPATGKPLTLRVMDFYHVTRGKILENWVCLDYGDLFHQMGIDLIARAAEMKPAWS
ncbi:MAG: ester cyclase [Rhodobacter sp.]|nr:ester cyclase [Rhodobacter sp.]